MSKETKEIKLTDIIPDENQPRKYFAAERMGSLRASVTKHGIMTPLFLEPTKGGKYLIVDGERRYRTAKELKLTTVPAVIVEEQTSQDRLIQQFHLQEQHESWTMAEKAIVVAELANDMKITIRELCVLLGIGVREGKTFSDFAKIVDKKLFQRSNISLSWVEAIQSAKTVMKDVYNKELKKDFERADEQEFETVVVTKIEEGIMRTPRELIKLKDAFRASPDSINKFLKTKVSPDKLWIDTGASAQSYIRNLMSSLNWSQGLSAALLKTNTKTVSPQLILSIKRTQEHLERMLSRFEA